MLFAKVLFSSLNITSKRFIRKPNLKAWPNDWVPFEWNRPETVPGYFDSGDKSTMKLPEREEISDHAKNSEEILKLGLDDPIRKVLSLQHSCKKDHVQAYSDSVIKSLGLIHELDFQNSLEYKITKLTFKLRRYQELISHFGVDNKSIGNIKTLANATKGRRYRYLTDLKEIHKDRYERIIKLLGIEPKENPINVPYIRPFRKVQMRRLAKEYALSLKEEKVEEFIRSLESEKAMFEKEKEETLRWIAEKEKELGTTVS